MIYINSFGTSSSYYLDTTSPDPISRSQATFDKAFGGLGVENRKFLFIDKNKWKRSEPYPEVDWDQLYEPGYLDGMNNALQNMVRNSLGEKFDADKLCQLHDSCVDGVFQDFEMNKPFKKGYGCGSMYSVRWQEISNEVIAELKREKTLFVVNEHYETEYPKYQNFEYLCVILPGDFGGKWEIRSRFQKKEELPLVHKKINDLFENYYTKIESSPSDDDKLAAIVNLCRALHMFHVFPDGNGRTILFALLPKLLIENGFSPAIVDDPSRCFTGYHSTEEMVGIIKQGMKNYQRLVEQLAFDVH